MDLLSTQNIWALRLLIILIFSNGESNSVTLSDLNRVCLYYFPFETDDTAITPPKNFCTAVATYGYHGSHAIDDHFNSSSFKGSLPYVRIYNEVIFLSRMRMLVKHRKVKLFVEKLNVVIKNNNVDVLVFDIGDTDFDADHHYSKDFQKNMKSFLNKIKGANQNVLFGLKINRNAYHARDVFDPNIVGDSADFYVVRSFDYQHCKYKNKQKNMAQPPTSKELQTTVNELKNHGFDLKKTFLTIEVNVRSFRNEFIEHPTSWSYSVLCEAHPGKRRKYCRGTLDNFYQQSKVVYDNGLPGIFIEAIDCDDYKGNCLCGSFPVARVILDGMNGCPENKSLTGCETFALLPKDRKP